ncbi:MAG: hypothetical protein J6C38_05210 [Oscillospiraceae bacterium]|nr:hypothetical protein [Oscillospiraceae bacterium]
MKVILFYILRIFFVKLELKGSPLIIEKRLIFRKTVLINRRDIVRVQTRRTLLLRLLHGKEVTIFTQNGKAVFYLSESEFPDFLPKSRNIGIKPRFPEILFGAFIDTRALAGIAVFAFTLRKIAKIFGGSYFDGIIRAIFTTAESLAKALEIAHIVFPKTAVFLAVFALLSWIFSFIRKILSLSRFEMSRKNGSVYVKSGLITLYENLLVPNTAAVISRKTLFSFVTKRAPIYFRDVMIFPCAGGKAREKILRSFFDIKIRSQTPAKSPLRAVFGHCALPMWSFFGFSAALLLLFITGNGSALITRTLLTAGIIISAYLFGLFFLFMKNAESSFSDDFLMISTRKGTALYSAFFPAGLASGTVFRQSVFQQLSGLCSVSVKLYEHKTCTARLIPFTSKLSLQLKILR